MERVAGVLRALSLPVGLVVWVGVGIWFTSFLELRIGLSGLPEDYPIGTPFTLAQAVAIFGAFGLAGGFSKYGDSAIRRELRLGGVMFLLSAFGFVVLGLFSPISVLPVSSLVTLWGITVLFLVFIVLSAVSFAVGTTIWLAAIPKLIDDGKRDKEPKCCSACDEEEQA